MGYVSFTLSQKLVVICVAVTTPNIDSYLGCRPGTAQRAWSVEILSTAAQLYKNHIAKGLQ